MSEWPQFASLPKPIRPSLKRYCHAHDRRNIFRSGAITLLLSARRMDERQITDQQRAHPRGATEFVRADGDHVGLGKRQLSSRLRAVGKDEAALLPDNGTPRVQRLDHAGLVLHVLDRKLAA